MIFLYFIFSFQLKIKLQDTESYLVYNGEDINLHLSDYNNSTEFRYNYNDIFGIYDNFFLRHNKNLGIGFNNITGKYVIDEKCEPIEIIAVPIEIYDRTYWLMHDNKCMEYEFESGTFLNSICDKKNKKQHFILDCNDYVKENDILDNEDQETAELHLSWQDKNLKYRNTEFTFDGKNENLSQVLMEKHGKHIIENVHKLLYDFSSCILQKNICLKSIWLEVRAKIKMMSYYESASMSSSKSSSSGSAYASSN